MNHENFSQAYALWTDFLDQIVYKQRFFLKHELLDYIKESIESNVKIITPTDKFYRARKYDDNVIDIWDLPTKIHNINSKLESETDRKNSFALMFQKLELEAEQEKEKTGFWGFQKGNNLAPPQESCVENGRANPQFIRYLYLSGSPYTCLTEVRPSFGDKISISEIRANKELKVADLSYDSLIEGDIDSVSYDLLYLINRAFHTVYTGDLKEYLPSQYIAEYIKSEHFDGIKYNSAMHPYGENYTFYCDDQFEDLNSKVYELDYIYMHAKCCNTPLESDILHPALKNLTFNDGHTLDRTEEQRIGKYIIDHPDILGRS